MIRFKPELRNVFAFGTDDETALHKALSDCFQTAIHLLCAIHLKEAIEHECKKIDVDYDQCIKEIMGVKCGDIKVKGLIDATEENEFDEMYEKLRTIWLEREGELFVEYMDKNKK